MLGKCFLLLNLAYGKVIKKPKRFIKQTGIKVFKLDLANFQLGVMKQIDVLPAVKVKSKFDQVRQIGLDKLGNIATSFATEYNTIYKPFLTLANEAKQGVKEISNLYKTKDPMAKVRYALHFGYTPLIIRLDKYTKLNLGIGGHYVFSYDNLDFELIKNFNLNKFLNMGELALGPSVQIKIIDRFRFGCNFNIKQVVRKPSEGYNFINQDFKLSSVGLDVFLGFRIFYGLEGMVGFNTSNSNLKKIFQNEAAAEDNNISFYFGLNYLN